MSSNLLKSVASVFVVLGAIALMAGGAMAQPKISGGAAAGFGQVSADSGSSATGTGVVTDGSTFNAQIEANVIVSGSNDKMDYYFRMRARGTAGDTAVNNGSSATDFTEGTFDDGQLQTVRVRVSYNATDAFSIHVGRLPGIGGTGMADKRPLRAPNNFRHPVNNLGFFDTPAIVLDYKAGAIRAGLAIASNCAVSCGSNGSGTPSLANLTAGTNPVNVDSRKAGNQQTMMPYFQGTFGGVKVGARLANASGDLSGNVTPYNCSTVPCTAGTPLTYDGSIDSSGTVVEASAGVGPATIGFEYTTTTTGCLDETPLTGTPCNDTDETDIAFSVQVAGILFQYSTQEVDSNTTGTEPAEATRMNIIYMMDVPGGQIGGEYATYDITPAHATGATNLAEPSGSMIRFIATTGF